MTPAWSDGVWVRASATLTRVHPLLGSSDLIVCVVRITTVYYACWAYAWMILGIVDSLCVFVLIALINFRWLLACKAEKWLLLG